MPLYHGKKVRLGHPGRASGPDAKNHKRWTPSKKYQNGYSQITVPRSQTA